MNSMLRITSRLAILGTLVLTLGAGPGGGLSERAGGLQVQSVTVQATKVTVVVANTSSSTLAGTLTVRPVAILPPISVPVVVGARRTISVVITFPGALIGGVTCGVVLDDGAPF